MEHLVLEKATLLTSLHAADTDLSDPYMEFVSISMAPEARLRLWIAPPSAYTSLTHFSIAALIQWQRETQVPAETLDELVDQSLFLPFAAADRDRMIRHVDYAFSPELLALLTNDIVDGVLLYAQWNIQAALFATSQHYFAFFWMTYV
jgi:hypothetical protein